MFFKENYSKSIVHHRTLIWLGEEIHRVDCEPNILLVDHGDLISVGFEILPGLFSKTSGLVVIKQKNNLVKTISIKSGVIYEGKKLKSIAKKLYYPGETLLSHITVKNLSFCEHIGEKNSHQLLVRPLEIYEFSYLNELQINNKNDAIFRLKQKSYTSGQTIKAVKSLNLVSNVLIFKTKKSLNNNINIELINNQKKETLDFRIVENLSLNSYIPPHLKYNNIQSCFLVQKNQFVSSYTTLGYLEATTSNSLEIIKVKIKKQKVNKFF